MSEAKPPEEKLYKVTRPNINLDGKAIAVGAIISLTEARAQALVNKVVLAPTAESLKAEAERLSTAAAEMAKKAKAAAENMAKKAKDAVTKAVSGKGSKGDKEAPK